MTRYAVEYRNRNLAKKHPKTIWVDWIRRNTEATKDAAEQIAAECRQRWGDTCEYRVRPVDD